MYKYTRIPSGLKKIDKNKDGYYEFWNSIDIVLEDNSLYKTHRREDKSYWDRLKCLKNLNEKYKLFVDKYMQVSYEAVYFVLDIEKQEVFATRTCLTSMKEEMIEWIEYLNDGGSLEKAEEENKLYQENTYDPFSQYR